MTSISGIGQQTSIDGVRATLVANAGGSLFFVKYNGQIVEVDINTGKIV